MKDHDILSKNPTGSGGIGLNAVLVDRSLGGLSHGSIGSASRRKNICCNASPPYMDESAGITLGQVQNIARSHYVDETWFSDITVSYMRTDPEDYDPNFTNNQKLSGPTLQWVEEYGRPDFFLYPAQWALCWYSGSELALSYRLLATPTDPVWSRKWGVWDHCECEVNPWGAGEYLTRAECLYAECGSGPVPDPVIGEWCGKWLLNTFRPVWNVSSCTAPSIITYVGPYPHYLEQLQLIPKTS